MSTSNAAGVLTTIRGRLGGGPPLSNAATATMLITLDDKELLDDLCVHFRRSGFAVERVGGAMVEIERRDAPSRDQGRREVLMHLRIWEILNRGHAAVSCT